MKKILLITYFSFLTLFGYSQNNKTESIQRVKAYLTKYQVNPSTGKVGHNPVIFFNNAEKIIDIDGYRVPLLEVKIIFENSFNNFWVHFPCKSGHCIVDPVSEKKSGFGVAFKTKENCYEFIDLISQLKK